MTLIKHRILAATLAAGLALACASAQAQGALQAYPAAAVAFLDAELPKMDTAVAAKDRAYFIGAMERMNKFLDAWGLQRNTAVLEAWPMCTDAVTDFQIVGLCRLSPPGTICEPGTFIPKFENNLARCRAAAGMPAKPASRP